MSREAWTTSEARIKQFVVGGEVRYLHAETSSVTTAWGANWSETVIACDIRQNPYDADRSRIDDIYIESDGPDVTVSAPSGYNLQRLF
jgi:hypothetical protein